MSDLILYSDGHLFPPTAEDLDRVRASGRELVVLAGHRPADFAAHPSAVAVVAWGGPYGTAVLDALPELRIIARCGAGFDNIDLTAAADRGVVVTYVPGGSDDEVAEHTVALLLVMARKISISERAVRAGRWLSSAELAPMTRVSGSTLALYGFGRIAQATASRAGALGLQVRAFDPFVASEVFDAAGVQRAPGPEELMAGADFVSLHVPGGGSTPLIGAAELAMMSPSTVLVNTARGSLVDTAALVEALGSGRLGGAALDVLDTEPVAPDHPLLGLDNVVITPHSAAFSRQALQTLRTSALSEVLTVLDGSEPRTPVPPRPADTTDEDRHR